MGNNEPQMLKWIKEVWIKHTRKTPSLLFLDSFSAHLTDAVKEAFKQSNTTVAVIPGGLTSVLQPLDVSINKPMKDYLRHWWNLICWTVQMLMEVHLQNLQSS